MTREIFFSNWKDCPYSYYRQLHQKQLHHKPTHQASSKKDSQSPAEAIQCPEPAATFLTEPCGRFSVMLETNE